MLVLLAIIVLSCLIYFYYRNYRINNYKPSEYEKDLIGYFNEVALNSEFYDNPKCIIKWLKPMKLFINKDGSLNEQSSRVKQVVDKINNLVTSGFNIQLVDDKSKANAIIYLNTPEQVRSLRPDFYKKFSKVQIGEDVAGFTYMEYRLDNGYINRAFVFININETLETQLSVILEELSQSIGIPNDSEKYKESIFFNNHADSENVIHEYSAIDKDVIKILYHPKMKAGYNARQANKVMKELFLNKEIKFEVD